MSDFKIIDVPASLAQKVTISGHFGERPDPDWNREAAETDYVFSELLMDRQLIASGLSISRRTDLTIMWSDLTPTGQAFVKAHFDKWVHSVDKSGTPEKTKRQKLVKRWEKFSAEQGKAD